MLDRGHESEKSVESYSHLFEHLRDELEYLDILVEFAMVRLGLNTKDSAFVNTDIKNQDRFIAVLREKRDSINFKLEKSREQGVIFPMALPMRSFRTGSPGTTNRAHLSCCAARQKIP
jgi:hypothetical protein